MKYYKVIIKEDPPAGKLISFCICGVAYIYITPPLKISKKIFLTLG